MPSRWLHPAIFRLTIIQDDPRMKRLFSAVVLELGTWIDKSLVAESGDLRLPQLRSSCWSPAPAQTWTRSHSLPRQARMWGKLSPASPIRQKLHATGQTV